MLGCPNMKINKRIQRFLISGTILISALFGNQNPLAAADGAASAERSSFQAVTSKLDRGGNLFLYMSTEQWLQGLSQRVADLEPMLAGLAGDDANAGPQIRKVVELLSGLVKNSGLEQISGVGASGIAIEKGLYRTKFFLHHYPGQNAGQIWALFGRKPHPLAELNLLPKNTAVAMTTDLDLALLWKGIQAEIQRLGIPEAGAGLQQFSGEFERNFGMAFDGVLDSLDGALGVILTLDDARTITIPLPPGGSGIEIPEPGLAFLARVKNDAVFKRIEALAQGKNEIAKVEKEGWNMLVANVPIPLPVPLKPTLAVGNGYLVLASSDRLVEEMIAALKGQSPGLRETPEFKRLSAGLMTTGNQFAFVSEKYTRTILSIVRSAMAAQGSDNPASKMLQPLLASAYGKVAYSVAANTEEGWLAESNGNEEPVAALMGPMVVAPVAVMAGMALPALANAKQKAQTIACINNLKQIGLAARVYATDHEDVLPKDFLSMKAELSTPKVLFCPQDAEHAPFATGSWGDLDLTKISYEMVNPGAKESEPEKVYVRCRIHGTECRADGSVVQRPK